MPLEPIGDTVWARRYGQITILGRMLDPFVDKVIICGTYIFWLPICALGLDGLDGRVVPGRTVGYAFTVFLSSKGPIFPPLFPAS